MSVHSTGISAHSPLCVAWKGNARLDRWCCCVGTLALPYFPLTSNFISGKTRRGSSSVQNAYTRQQLAKSVFRNSHCSTFNEASLFAPEKLISELFQLSQNSRLRITSKVLWMRKSGCGWPTKLLVVALCRVIFSLQDASRSPRSTIKAGTEHISDFEISAETRSLCQDASLALAFSLLSLCLHASCMAGVLCWLQREGKRVWQRLRITPADLLWPKTHCRGLYDTSHSAYFFRSLWWCFSFKNIFYIFLFFI